MRFQRSSGVLLHVTSLPSLGGIGDLGPAAYEFVQFLAAAGQHVWQVLPLSPTGYGNSPYAATSAFAGNPALISLEILRDWGWITDDQLAALPGATDSVDFGRVEAEKFPLLAHAADQFLARAAVEPQLQAQWQGYKAFCAAEAGWLEDYALYAVLRTVYRTGAWVAWPEAIRHREPEAVAAARAEHAAAIERERVLQYAFSEQWKALRSEAASHGIRILGDVAIFVNMDSADVWCHPELFELDEALQPIRIAGVPPDYFSPTGQRWGNPLYRWDVLARQGYAWWVERIRRAHALYDIIRLDHFRGFEAYWAIPASEETAIHGEWIKAPGAELFAALERELGALPLVAEDLGLITPEVDELRKRFALPGMKVLQFGFGDKGAHLHLPPLHTVDTVAYTGTHDNDTTEGWWRKASVEEKVAVEALVGPVKGHPVWPLIRAAEASVAEMAIVPVQDLLELGSAARMNTPAVPAGNWAWRVPAGAWRDEIAERMRAIVDVTDRDKDPLALVAKS